MNDVNRLIHSVWGCKYHIGRDEAAIKKYIQEQEEENQRQDQLEMFKDS